MVEHMRAWVDAGCPPPVLHVLPARTSDGDLPDGAVVDKRHSRLVLAFTPDEKGTPARILVSGPMCRGCRG